MHGLSQSASLLAVDLGQGTRPPCVLGTAKLSTSTSEPHVQGTAKLYIPPSGPHLQRHAFAHDQQLVVTSRGSVSVVNVRDKSPAAWRVTKTYPMEGMLGCGTGLVSGGAVVLVYRAHGTRGLEMQMARPQV